jgi:Carboxypeptidase regulatory-like domain
MLFRFVGLQGPASGCTKVSQAMIRVVRVALAAMLLALPLVACNDSDLPPAGQYATFKGVVTDASTQQPIANAVITIDTVLQVTTDATGSFSIGQVPSGIVDYVIKAKGYKDITASANAEPGKTFQLNVAMQQPTLP